MSGEQWVVTGTSGSGKTTLARVIAGTIFFNGQLNWQWPGKSNSRPMVVYVPQQHIFRSRSGQHDLYYQQRYNAWDAEDSLTVREYLSPDSAGIPEKEFFPLIEEMHLAALLDEPLIQLSNGENKRLQLIKALLSKPDFLALDNPFTGLDAEGRGLMRKILESLVLRHSQVLMITDHSEIPDGITHQLILQNGKILFAGERSLAPAESHSTNPAEKDPSREVAALYSPQDHEFEIAIRMFNAKVDYGGKTILKGINWEVKKGERWLITGPNGSGKSTLLSLVTADNPQAYANEIYLFDKRRGRGESIWDIKKRIGYVSPELHLFFDSSCTCFEVIASGLFDHNGLFRRLNAGQESQVEKWISALKLEEHRMKPLYSLPAGQQRMAFLARALIKSPPLLVLDEPCQGLDSEQVAFFLRVIDRICTDPDCTLLFVSHYTDEVPDCLTHALQINQGSLEKQKSIKA